MYLVERNEGISVNELLLKLKITKQSLNRVLRDLKRLKMIKQSIDNLDTRRRLLYLDDNGKKRKLTVDDFLIISPYNTQVNLLISKLEEAKIKNPRVGTIDKFQGQEAPITIISMTSSDNDSLPSTKEFFFSRHRLNVAISRAQVASIILFNPKLLDSSPKNLDQRSYASYNAKYEDKIVQKMIQNDPKPGYRHISVK